MKDTKYLFNPERPTFGMVSVSQIQTFLSCKRKWHYNYIDNLTPRIDKKYLTVGKLCHLGMQKAMYHLWQDSGNWCIALSHGIEAIKEGWSEYMEETLLLPEEIPDMEQMREDALSVFRQAFQEFEPWRWEVLSIWRNKRPEPALELHFCVPCPPTKGLHGFIDAILRDKETGCVWCVDYKFRKSLSPDEDETFNIQNAVYSYACMKMGIQIAGTMTWQHVNTPAADPAVLKNGAVSRAKIKTTWEHYEQFLMDHNEDPHMYEEEMIPKLADIEWFRATLEYRNEDTIREIWSQCVVPAAKGIKSAYNRSANNYRSMYPWNCKMCQYQSLCQAGLRGYDERDIIQREYTRRGDNKVVDTPENSVVQ